MTRSLLSSLVLSAFASLMTACVAAPAADAPAGEELQEASAELAIADSDGEQNLTCPGVGTCAKIDYSCANYGTNCSGLARCYECYPDGC